MDPRVLLLVGGAETPELRHALARRRGRAVLMSFAEILATVDDDPIWAGKEAADFRQPLAVARRIGELHVRHAFAGIVPLGEFGLLPAAMAAQRLGLPGPPLRAVMDTRDKRRMRQVLEAAGLGQVRHAACRSVGEAEAFLRKVGGSIIVKPEDGTGSDGVSRVEDPSQLEAAFTLARGARAVGGVLCEEFVEGPEVSVEGVCVGRRFVPVAMTDKLTDDRFLETGHDQPTGHSRATQQAAFDLAGRILEALGVADAVTHTEFKLTPRGPVLIETHTRMGGDRIHVLTHHTTGVDLADTMVALALGERPDIAPYATGRAASIRFVVGRAGRIARIDAAGADGGFVEEVKLAVGPGAVVRGRSSSLDRLGHVLAVAPRCEQAAQAADEARARVAVEYEVETAAFARREEEPWTAPVA